MNTDKILIGWGSKDITPEGPAILVGQFHVRISESVKDPLTVTALALESEDKNNLVGPEGGQMIVNEQVRMINEMFSS